MELTISTPRLAAARILPRTPRAFYRTAINAFFFVMGMVFASWAVRIPDIKAALQMSDAALGSVLLAAPLGEMLSIAPTAWLIGRFRSRRVIMLGLMLMPCALLSLALAGSPPLAGRCPAGLRFLPTTCSTSPSMPRPWAWRRSTAAASWLPSTACGA